VRRRASGARQARGTAPGRWQSPAAGRLGDRDALAQAIDALRPILAPRAAATQRTPRAGTKQETVLALLRRAEGATIAQVMEATAWQPHTVRGFLAGLKNRRIKVEVLERVRQVGPNKQGARGSFTVYRVDA
jgi:hypothetical protein